MKKRAAILIDEMNAIKQIHKLGIEGINPWKVFFQTVEKIYINKPTDYRFYGAVISKSLDPERNRKRSRFFNRLSRDGIKVKEGFVVLDHKGALVEKGVDVQLSLDLLELSLKGFDEVIVFSADGDLVPAVHRAQRNGTIVKAILSKNVPAGHLSEAVDEIIRLEDVISHIPSDHKSVRQKKIPNNYKECGVA
ncbi:NYN domain-containing protein [Bacillus sp. UMB0728]|uniref:NYN domain-containing protein n=1 Tax=Bacillus sp. UMB0728 TaxID=2066052 RepID=UPI0015DDB129|nr:NYN domain-containing protein [Bacillus sp. UMB0728]